MDGRFEQQIEYLRIIKLVMIVVIRFNLEIHSLIHSEWHNFRVRTGTCFFSQTLHLQTSFFILFPVPFRNYDFSSLDVIFFYSIRSTSMFTRILLPTIRVNVHIRLTDLFSKDFSLHYWFAFNVSVLTFFLIFVVHQLCVLSFVLFVMLLTYVQKTFCLSIANT